jgi:3-hydroxyacyl-[acyl-carrier-protein] dehydratase
MHNFDYDRSQDNMTWVLAAVPHRPPFRFIDDILELDESHILGSYRYRASEFFYEGNFPGCPVTPGAILIETMAQIAGLAFGIFLSRRKSVSHGFDIPILTCIESAALFAPVYPGEQVFVRGERMYFRKQQLKIGATMTMADGQEVCRSVLIGTLMSDETIS